MALVREGRDRRVRCKRKTLLGAIRAMIEQLLILVPLSGYFSFFFRDILEIEQRTAHVAWWGSKRAILHLFRNCS